MMRAILGMQRGWAALAVAAMVAAGTAAEQQPGDTMKTAGGVRAGPLTFDGRGGRDWPEARGIARGTALTVAAWIEAPAVPAEHVQTIAAQWAPRESFDAFDAYDAGRTGGLDTSGFLGAVFDGRHVYFVPQHDAVRRHGRVLRYDTHAPFRDPASWEAYDAETTGGLTIRGYYGATFDGAYVYFTPRTDGTNCHTRVLRYDTRQPFGAAASWAAFDVGLSNSYQGCAFDGRYVYFAPGKNMDNTRAGGWPAPALRYDTTRPFDRRESYEVFELTRLPGLEPGEGAAARSARVDQDGIAFDGRYLYYAPIIGKQAVRFDTTRPFTDPASWAWIRPAGLDMCVGPVFDGQFVWFPPYRLHDAVRYDTAGAFEDPAAWSRLNLKQRFGAPYVGYDGGFYDGRFVYFVPFIDWAPGLANRSSQFHGIVSRYDTLKSFEDRAAWAFADAGETAGLKTVGYNGGASDGRFLYFAPWHDGAEYEKTGKISGHGRVLRYDTTGSNAAFALRLTDLGHNGGLCAAVPGPTFVVNTDQGVFSARASRLATPGRRHLAGVYDGQSVALYLDGALVNRQPARGALCVAAAPVTLGKLSNGTGYFRGVLREVRLLPAALEAGDIAALFRAGTP